MKKILEQLLCALALCCLVIPAHAANGAGAKADAAAGNQTAMNAQILNQAKKTGDILPTDKNAGPVIVFDKVSFKNVAPDIDGWGISCYVDQPNSGLPVATGASIKGTKAFKDNPSLRTSAEYTNVQVQTELYEPGQYNKDGMELSKGTSWHCYVVAVTNDGGYIPFMEGNCASGCVTAGSIVSAKGNF